MPLGVPFTPPHKVLGGFWKTRAWIWGGTKKLRNFGSDISKISGDAPKTQSPHAKMKLSDWREPPRPWLQPFARQLGSEKWSPVVHFPIIRHSPVIKWYPWNYMFVMRVSQAYIILKDSAIASWEKDQPSQVKLQHDILTHMVYFYDNCRSIHNRPVRIRHGMNINTFAVSKNPSKKPYLENIQLMEEILHHLGWDV